MAQSLPISSLPSGGVIQSTDATVVVRSGVNFQVTVPVDLIYQTQAALANKANLVAGVVPVGELPIATAAALGVVKPDNTTITITAGGVISAVGGGGGSFTFAPVNATSSGAIPVGQTWTTIAANSVTLTLPALSVVTAGSTYVIKALNFTGGGVVANGSDPIDGVTSTTLNLNPLDSVQLLADTVNGSWLVW